MGVASYGLTACSMEEIFVQLTRKEAAQAPDGNACIYICTCVVHVILYRYTIYTVQVQSLAENVCEIHMKKRMFLAVFHAFTRTFAPGWVVR